MSPATKEALAGKTLIFSRRLTVAELEGRLVTRIQDDYDVGHVDAELAAGTVEYLALGSRVTGIGSTPAPGTVAVGTDDAVDPFPDDPTLAPGDAVYVVSRPETYRRLDARSRPA